MRAFAIALLVVAAAAGCSKSSTTTTPYSSTAPSAAPTASAMAASAAAVHSTTDAKLGKILVDASGRTLYVFDKDTGGTIACTAACTGTWPPLTTTGPQASSSMSGIGTVQRPDGTTQVTYKSRPLYRYSGDTKAGDTNGDGVGGIWHAAKVT